MDTPIREARGVNSPNSRVVISPPRPTTSLDHGPGRTMRIDCGIVVSGQLEVQVLEEKARVLVSQWPELAARMKEVKPGQFETLPSHVDDAISFEARFWYHKSLLEAFPSALYQYRPKSPSTKITSYTSSTNNAKDIFSWNTLPIHAYGKKNLPSLTFRVTVLKDATLIGIIVPHVMIDGTVLGHIVQAYAALVRGESIEPRTGSDPSIYHPPIKMKDLQAGPTSRPTSLRVSDFWSTSLWIALLSLIEGLYNAWWGGSYQTVYHIPSRILNDVKNEARMAAPVSSTSEGRLPVSKLDVALACSLKIFANTEISRNPNKGLSVMYTHDIRSYLENLPAKYLHNAWVMTYLHWDTIKQIQDQALIDLAIEIRDRINDQRSPEEVKKQLEFFELASHQPGAVPYDGHFRVDISSWVGMDLENVMWSTNGDEDSSSQEKETCLGDEELPGPYGETIAIVPKLRYPFDMAINNQGLFHNDKTGDGLFVFATVKKGWWGKAWKASRITEL